MHESGRGPWLTERVVDQLEPIKVYEQHRKLMAPCPARTLMRVRNHRLEHRTVRDARQSIVGCQEIDVLLGEFPEMNAHVTATQTIYKPRPSYPPAEAARIEKHPS